MIKILLKFLKPQTLKPWSTQPNIQIFNRINPFYTCYVLVTMQNSIPIIKSVDMFWHDLAVDNIRISLWIIEFHPVIADLNSVDFDKFAKSDTCLC